MFNLLGGAISGGAGGLSGGSSEAGASQSGDWNSGGPKTSTMDTLVKVGAGAGAVVSLVALFKLVKGK